MIDLIVAIIQHYNINTTVFFILAGYSYRSPVYLLLTEASHNRRGSLCAASLSYA